MAWIGAGDLKERLAVRRFVFDEAEGRWLWETEWNSWAKATEDDRSNLFSSVGIGARGVTFIMRRNAKLTLHKAFLWRGKHCFLTAITDHEQPGFSVVKAALVDAVTCTARSFVTVMGPGNRPQQQEGESCCFPSVVTEKYVRYAREEPYGTNVSLLVLVTPKDILLTAGALVMLAAEGKRASYSIQTRHLLDEYKNEYELHWSRDV